MNEESQYDMVIAKINELSKKHIELNEQIKNLKFEDNAVKEQIKTIAESIGQDRFEDEVGYVISITTTTQNRFDKKLVEKYLTPDVLKECYKEGEPFTTIRWKKKDEN